MNEPTYILGVNTVYHELAACLLKNGQIVGAVEEERFSRIKRGKKALVDNPNVIPIQAIQYCLNLEGLELKDITHIALPFSPKDRLENINIDPYFTEGDWGSKTGEELFNNKLMEVPALLSRIAGADVSKKIQWVPHHVAHAASAYFVSPFNESAILAIDGIGEIASTWMGKGKENKIEKINEIKYPHSLGFVWEKMSQFLGFSEYDSAKVMGLAAFGDPEKYHEYFQGVIQLKNNGVFSVDNNIFKFRLDSFEALEKLFGVQRIHSPAARTSDHEDIAAALQKITNDVMLHLAHYMSESVGSRKLCLAGGVALNCVANAELMQGGYFDEIYIQPAANDAGTALGAAFYIWHEKLKKPRKFVMEHVYWGPEFNKNEIELLLKNAGVTYEECPDIARVVAERLTEGGIVGWFQGRMEWGPRALGNRSLLADPRNPQMKRILNERIKKREPYRPFAPSVLAEECANWFENHHKSSSLSSEFMEINFMAKKNKVKKIPAVVHVDGTSRVQVVNKKTNPLYHKLIFEFQKITGVPMVLNTSFNDNEPIVCTPENALKTFLRTKMDYLAIGNFLVSK